MGFDVRAIPAEEFSTWVAATRSAGDRLDTAQYARLAAPSINNAPKTFGQVSPGLFNAVVHGKGAVPTSLSETPRRDTGTNP
jgi:COX Aromatic Rich Motif